MYPAKPSDAAPSVPQGMYPAMPAGTGPAAGIPVGVKASQWSSGLCDCFDDCGLCCVTYWCPCITFGRVAEIVDQGATSCGTAGALYALLAYLTGCQWVYSCAYRAKLRAQFGLPDEPCCDCCVHFCCQPCALCQEHRELKARGYDPVRGWDFDAQRGAPMYPPAAPAPAHQAMGR